MTGNSLKSLLENNSELFLKKPSELFKNGTNIRRAKNQDHKSLKLILIKELNDLLEFVDANKTISTAEELTFTVTSIIEDYPAMTVEEILLVFSRIKKGQYGKYYERFKTPEILEAIKSYESEERPQILKEHNQRFKQEEMRQLKPDEIVDENKNTDKFLTIWRAKISESKQAKLKKAVQKSNEHKDRLKFFIENEDKFKALCDLINQGQELTKEGIEYLNKCGIKF